MRSVILVLVVSVLAGCGDLNFEAHTTEGGGLEMSIFRNTRRAIQPPQAQSVQAFHVATEDELLNALTAAPRNGSSYGRSIVVVDDITLSRTITLVAGDHDGLTITSFGRGRLSTSSTLTSGFDIRASSVLISNLHLSSDFSATNAFLITGALGATGLNVTISQIDIGDDAAITNLVNISEARGTTITGCSSVSGDGIALFTTDTGATTRVTRAVIVDNSGFDGPVSARMTASIISGNMGLGENGPTSLTLTNSSNNIIMGNRLANGLVITGATSARNVVSGNTFVGSPVTTNAGGGNGTITGNTGISVLTAAGTDNTTGGNT